MIWSLFRSCFTSSHICPDSATQLDRVMVQNGWKYCPGIISIIFQMHFITSEWTHRTGCRTPIEKRSGCNYMNVSRLPSDFSVFGELNGQL
jgi:hypothetical protein